MTVWLGWALAVLAVAENPETWAWCDAGGDEVQVELRGGRVAVWRLLCGAGAGA